jgi:hypothetical protein
MASLNHHGGYSDQVVLHQVQRIHMNV